MQISRTLIAGRGVKRYSKYSNIKIFDLRLNSNRKFTAFLINRQRADYLTDRKEGQKGRQGSSGHNPQSFKRSQFFLASIGKVNAEVAEGPGTLTERRKAVTFCFNLIRCFPGEWSRNPFQKVYAVFPNHIPKEKK